MSADLATIALDQPVAQAVDIMIQRGISSVLVMRNSMVEGILTEKDVLRTVLAQGKDPQQIQVVDVMSFPVINIPPSHSVLSASRLMYDKHLHRLVVADEQGACGIITRTDILKGYQSCTKSSIQQELHLLIHAHDAVFLLDAEDNTTFVNPAFLELFQADSPDCFIDRPFPPDELWINPEDRYTFAVEMDLAAGGIVSLFLRTVTGVDLPVRLCLGDIRDFSGRVVGKKGIVWDMIQDPL
jgi:PAS domain-containing protein